MCVAAKKEEMGILGFSIKYSVLKYNSIYLLDLARL